MTTTTRTIPANARTPFDRMFIFWEVDNTSGTTAVPAWEVQYTIESLERAGYRILTVTRSY